MELSIKPIALIIEHCSNAIAPETKQVGSIFANGLKQLAKAKTIPTEEVHEQSVCLKISGITEKFLANVRSILSKSSSITSIGKLTEEEAKAIELYVSEYDQALAIADPSNPCSKGLKRALNKSRLREDTVLYRGIRHDEINNLENTSWQSFYTKLDELALRGYSFTASAPRTKVMPFGYFKGLEGYFSRGYSSTSTSFDVAKQFQLGNGLIFRIKAPKGTKCISMQDAAKKIPSLGEEAVKNIANENEVLLPPGTRFKINGFTKGADGMTIVDVSI